MSSQEWTEPLVQRLMTKHRTSDPREAIRRYAASLRQECDQTDLPVDVEVIRSCLGIRRTVGEYDFAGRIYAEESGQLIMNLRASDSYERQRFTCAHELIHPAFPGFSRDSRYRLDEQVGRNRVGRSEEEYLCDFGAAELLMPADIVKPAYSVSRGLGHVERLAQDAEVSLEAAANRLVEIADEPAALLVLYEGHKPADRGALRRGEDVPERLRVHYCVARDIRVFVPRFKSADEGSVFVRALREPGVSRATEPLPGAATSREFMIEAKEYPLGDRRRVIALAVPAES
jgi:hypothetical protein